MARQTTLERVTAQIASINRLKTQANQFKAARLSRQLSETRLSSELSGVPLYELIPLLSPTIRGIKSESPYHLSALVEELEAAIEPHPDQRFYWFSVPPRHWKSETLKHALIKHLIRWPEHDIAYCTHTATFAGSQSRDVRNIAKRAGIELSDDSNRKDEWHATTGCGLVARGVGGEVTGRGFRLIVIDDPVKSREVAESPVERAKIFNWIEDDVITRLTPDGVVILVHTRWHPDDPIGRYLKRAEWRGTNIQAIRDVAGVETALLPTQWPIDKLTRIRDVNPLRFEALYQGGPRPRGGKLFGASPAWYQPSELPKVGYRVAHGLDLAYSKKTHADRSVLISGTTDGHRIFLTDCKVRRERSDEFIETVRPSLKQNPGSVRWYCSGIEKAIADLFGAAGVYIDAIPTGADKYTRAQPAAKLWNKQRILLPASLEGEEQPDWVTELIEELGAFTGINDPHDDIVDALGGLVDEFGLQDDEESSMAALLELTAATSGNRWSDYTQRGL